MLLGWGWGRLMYWGLVCGEGVEEHLEEDKEEVGFGRYMTKS